MKKLILPAICIFSLTIFSFKGKSEKVFELQENGNFKVLNGSKISSEDAEEILKMTKEVNGAKSFLSIKIFSTSVSSGTLKSELTKSTQDDCGCPDKRIQLLLLLLLKSQRLLQECLTLLQSITKKKMQTNICLHFLSIISMVH